MTLNLTFRCNRFLCTAANLTAAITGSKTGLEGNFLMEDNFNGTPAAQAADSLGVVVGKEDWGLENKVQFQNSTSKLILSV
jgi:hypothetical protein